MSTKTSNGMINPIIKLTTDDEDDDGNGEDDDKLSDR